VIENDFTVDRIDAKKYFRREKKIFLRAENFLACA